MGHSDPGRNHRIRFIQNLLFTIPIRFFLRRFELNPPLFRLKLNKWKIIEQNSSLRIDFHEIFSIVIPIQIKTDIFSL